MLSKSRILGALWAALVVACALAPGASAVVVHSPTGQFLGVAPRPGVAPAAIPGAAAAARPAASAGTVTAADGSWWDNLHYQGGPVLHSSDPYVIFWNPNGGTGPSLSLIDSYFSDVAGDSTKATNVYAVARQFTDSAGFADYQQTFNPASQVIQDVDSFPQPAASECAGSPYTTCLSDQQLQTEITSVITAANLPTDGPTGASELPSGAPIYFVVLPSNVDVCDSTGSCASNEFCAYHSYYPDGPNTVLYAAIPSVALNSPQDAKGCQWDGNSLVQEPNGSLTDVVLKYISHEDNETITDPLGTGWYSWYGNEDGDNCNDTDWSANAFAPTLGGDASAGTLYNQLIAGHEYYLQSEWSNGGSSCLMQPSGGTITPRFAVPSAPRTAGSALTFDPTASTATYRFTSETWDFGDGTPTSFHAGRTLTAATHTYAAPGRYTVTLTLVDSHGELSTTSEPITVGESPTAAFTASPTQLLEGSGPVNFDATGSTTDAGSISSYTWDFGDGSASGQGATASHTYATHGTYLVRLTITDSAGNVDTASQTITVTDEPPVAAFAIGNPAPEVGQGVSFDGSASSDSDGSIIWYSWNFGDGHTASGPTPSHTFANPGTYTVTLRVTDSDWQRTSVSQTLTVLPGPSAQFNPSTTRAGERTAVGFDATGSAAGGAGAAIQAYAWSFGDGATATGPAPSHTYGGPGTYTVTLTVTDGAGVSTSTTHTVTVIDEPPTAAFNASPAVPIPGQSVRFDGNGSRDSDEAIASYAWDFGDGATAAGRSPSHAYAAPGTYNVHLTVVDASGQRASLSEPVTVYAQPLATFGYSPGLPVEGAGTTFTAISSSSDPATMISSYQWSFGDGTTASGVGASHTYAHQGSYRVTLTVTDGLGLTSSISEVVTVIDGAPTPVISMLTAHPMPGHPIVFSGARSHDSDDPVVSWLWHFGGGAEGVGKKFSHTFARAGTYRVSLTVRDSFGQTATTTTIVRVGRSRDVSTDHRSSRRRRRKR